MFLFFILEYSVEIKSYNRIEQFKKQILVSNILHKRKLLYCLMVLQYIHSKLSSDEDDEQQYNKL